MVRDGEASGEEAVPGHRSRAELMSYRLYETLRGASIKRGKPDGARQGGEPLTGTPGGTQVARSRRPGRMSQGDGHHQRPASATRPSRAAWLGGCREVGGGAHRGGARGLQGPSGSTLGNVPKTRSPTTGKGQRAHRVHPTERGMITAYCWRDGMGALLVAHERCAGVEAMHARLRLFNATARHSKPELDDRVRRRGAAQFTVDGGALTVNHPPECSCLRSPSNFAPPGCGSLRMDGRIRVLYPRAAT